MFVRDKIAQALFIIAAGAVIILVAILLAESSGFPAAKRPKTPVVESTPSPLPTTDPSPTPSPTATPGTEKDLFTIKGSVNYNDTEQQRLELAIEAANDVVESKCFEDFMTNRSLIQTNGLTPKQVVEKLRAKPYAFELVIYYANNRTVGYTYPTTQTIWQNRKFFAGAHPVDIASNLVHEYAHKVGFDHDFKATTRRPYSVPYSINAAISSCGETLGLYKRGRKDLNVMKLFSLL